MDQKLTSKKLQDKFFFLVTIVFLKENSKVKDKFSRKFLPRNKKHLFFGSKMGAQLIHRIDLYMLQVKFDFRSK